MTILYTLGDKLYINVTNRCPCSCKFCIRYNGSGVGSADSLWLERDPTASEVIEALSGENLDAYRQIVYCGYGEPLCALDTVIESAGYIKEHTKTPVRINTNGMGDLINGKPVVPLLKGLVDSISISLNAPDADSFYELCRPSFGKGAFDAMLEFTRSCKPVIPQVILSVVDFIDQKSIEKCRRIAAGLGVEFRVREWEH